MWRLAWRNLLRNRTRSLITGTAIGLSLALQLFSYGIADSTYQKMTDAAVRSMGGHVLIQAKGYWEAPSTERFIAEPQGLTSTLSSIDGVQKIIPRVLTSGLVSSARANAGVQLFGIHPDLEASIDDKSRFLSEGSFLGEPHRAPLVLGKKLVQDLGIELGDRIRITVSDAEGESARAAFWLTGIIDSGNRVLDESTAYTTFESAQRVLRMNGATQVALVLDHDEQRHQLRDEAKRLLVASSDELEFLLWDEANPELTAFIELDRKMSSQFGFLIFIVVAFGIVNTFLMSVLERVRELGLLSALGLTPARIAQLVLMESFLLAFMSISIGVLLAFGTHLYIAETGIDFSKIMGTEMEISGVILEDMTIYSVLRPIRWLTTSAVVLLLVLASALYPALRATRLEAATAMRTYA